MKAGHMKTGTIWGHSTATVVQPVSDRHEIQKIQGAPRWAHACRAACSTRPMQKPTPSTLRNTPPSAFGPKHRWPGRTPGPGRHSTRKRPSSPGKNLGCMATSSSLVCAMYAGHGVGWGGIELAHWRTRSHPCWLTLRPITTAWEAQIVIFRAGLMFPLAEIIRPPSPWVPA